MKEIQPEIFRLLRVLPNKKGFSLVEILFTGLILSFIIGIFFYAMNAGQLSFNFSSARANLQSQVRRTINWIIKDARQAVSWEIANNSPTPDYIKFRQVTGWDTVNNTFLLSNYYVEYTYSSADKTITRRTSDLSNNTTGTWIFNNVVASPFYTRDTSGFIVAMNQNDLLTSKQLVINISGQLLAWAGQTTSFSLTEDVHIRNG